MPASRAIVVLGMHRSGTSALTRGLKALGVYLGDNFLAARPDNPTGYWEDQTIVELNERLLDLFGLKWESVALIDDTLWLSSEVRHLQDEAVSYLRDNFVSHPLWGFKDPRTIRLLPFWRSVFGRLEIDDSYVLAIRHPLSIAASLLKRQDISAETSHLLTLTYLGLNLEMVASKPFVVTDYDLLLADPDAQLARIARRLNLPSPAGGAIEMEFFVRHFLDRALRHDLAGRHGVDTVPLVGSLVRQIFFLLYELASDRIPSGTPEFWRAWRRLRGPVQAAIAGQVARDKQAERAAAEFRFSDRALFPGTGVRLFAVISAQGSGSDLLREILNGNDDVAMLGEVLWPDPAPAHWDNFIRDQRPGAFPTADPQAMEALLDRYFAFVYYRIRNHWAGGEKNRCRAIGVDIKYNQLRRLAPANWSSDGMPFLLSYLKARGTPVIHLTRGDIGARERESFLELAGELTVTECRYEDLEEVAPRALAGIVKTLGARSGFSKPAR